MRVQRSAIQFAVKRIVVLREIGRHKWNTAVFGFRFPVTDVANKQELYKVITNVPYPTKTIPMGETVCP